MKRCPTCKQTYSDDALGFCLNDGTPLMDEAGTSADLQATIMSPAPIKPPTFAEAPAPSYQAAPQTWPADRPAISPPAQSAQKKPMVAYFIIGGSVIVAGFLLFIWLIGAIAGIGGALIHLLLLLALLVGFIGIVGGLILLFAGKR